jgi:hypothetical protein
MRNYLSTGDAARIAGVAQRTVVKWIDKLGLPSWKMPRLNSTSGHRCIKPRDFLDFLEQHKIPYDYSIFDCLFSVLVIGNTDLSIWGKENLGADRVSCTSDVFWAGMLAQKCPPSLTVIDFCIGRGEAMKIASNLTQGEDTKDTRLLALANEDEPDESQLTIAGFHKVWIKPVSSDSLVTFVQQEMDLWNRR